MSVQASVLVVSPAMRHEPIAESGDRTPLMRVEQSLLCCVSEFFASPHFAHPAHPQLVLHDTTPTLKMLSLYRLIGSTVQWLMGADRYPSPQLPQLGTARRRFAGSPSCFRPTNALGPHYLTVFAKMYETHTELNACKAQVAEHDDNFRDRQERMILAQSKIDCVENDERFDFSNVLGDAQQIIRQETPRQKEELATITRIETRIIDLEGEFTNLWRDVVRYAQDYMRRCFETQFEAEWSIKYRSCIDLYAMVDLHKFNEERRRELGAMKVERAFARHQNGESDLEARIQNLERILRHARNARDEMTDYFINSAVKPMLIANALVELPAESPGSAHKVDVPQGLENTSPGPREALSPEGLYMEARDELIELEETLERHELIWQKVETTYLMLFPHLTREHFAAYVQSKLQPVKSDLLEAQENFRKATEELARLGRDIPSMTELSSPTSTRGSQRRNSSRGSDSQSEGSRYERWLRKRKAAVRVKRDSINRWQISSKPGDYAMVSGTPPPDLALDGLTAKGSRPPTLSPEQIPSPAKRRKLKEYTAAQKDARATFA